VLGSVPKVIEKESAYPTLQDEPYRKDKKREGYSRPSKKGGCADREKILTLIKPLIKAFLPHQS